MPCVFFVQTDKLVLPTQLLDTSLANVMENPKPGPMSFLVARAVGSVGFAVSVVAIGLEWILPASKTDIPPSPPPTRRHSKSRRKSAPAALAAPTRVSSRKRQARPHIHSRANSLQPSSVRVRSADSKTEPSSPPSAPVVPPIQAKESPAQLLASENQPSLAPTLPPPPPAPLQIAEGIASSSHSSPLTTTPVKPLSVQLLDAGDESLESDTSHLPSRPHRFNPKFPRMKVFTNKTRQLPSPTSPPESSHDAINAPIEAVRPFRRSLSGFVNPWALSRSRTVADVTMEAAPTKASTSSSSPPFNFSRRSSNTRASIVTPADKSLPSTVTSQDSSASTQTTLSKSLTGKSNKSDRRRSAPAARTQPYAYPYFAAMPSATSGDDDSFDAGASLIRRQTMGVGSVADLSRGRGKRQSNNASQVAMGLGRSLHKRRSTSEHWPTRSGQIQVS